LLMYCNPPPQILEGCNPLAPGSYAHANMHERDIST
jgi:hypothetical protein